MHLYRNFEFPQTLDEWINSLFEKSLDKNFELSLVSEFTLAHCSPVDAATEAEETGMKGGKIRDVEYFTSEWLSKEREYIEKMGFSVDELLGEDPPWI